MTSTEKTPAAPRRLRLALLPLGLFAALTTLFWVGLFSGDKSKIPSALIGKPVPAFALTPLPGSGLPGFGADTLNGQVTLVNVWASWCIPCREEHPQLVELAKDPRFKLYGLNYKDKDDNAKAFLGRFGNPYVAVGVDPSGRTGIDWGVYGVPETFVIGRDGTIRYKFIGPIMPDTLKSTLLPEIEKALAN
ncbi:DsbE family thiol:disulfide interchange protein [Blastochloris viridis]|uniref:Cytochrome c biogenesis protein CycY n=1 Tax=Blastochloris viridis TaxID=1079 RepID=A0A0H5B9P0_BLAVI|nr:DsbE family thiol:disulfide interchange protein [Blastochloris viridis]ALK07819.1 Thiol:disulfide interchange protein CycY precursor [Blastochloris viridis]BAR98932.1 cytochrome c-type biogenesis protein CcmG/DsbE [Blastochloris viridis]CUU43741.1 Cytochrome c biogenesis protein CycY [Blastochloris viridis]